MSVGIDTHTVNGFAVFSVATDLHAGSSLKPLEDLVADHLRQGETHMAVRFSPDSFLSTANVAICARCVEAVRRNGGAFGFVNPNPQVLAMLQMTSLFLVADIVEEEAQLAYREEPGRRRSLSRPASRRRTARRK